MNPKPQTVMDWCDTLRKLARPIKKDRAGGIDILEDRLLHALNRDKGPAPARDGYPTGGGDGRGGGDGSTVESAIGAPEPRDQVHVLVQGVMDYGQQMIASYHAMLSKLDELDRISQPDKPHGQRAAAQCSEKYCEDPAEKGGRCQACYLWRYREAQRQACTLPEVGPVPKQVIDDRLALRENRKVHINGPLAS